MKFVQEHCSICNKTLAMQVVQEDEKHASLIWVRCPECQEIKPIEISGYPIEQPIEQRAHGLVEGMEDDSIQPGPKGAVRHYRAGERFNTGEWIYHPGWEDTGQVIEKVCSKGGREVIIVDFQKLGKKRLVSNFAC